MFQTSENLAPRHNPSLFGNAKERTASYKSLRKSLKEIGIKPDHYLFRDIEDIFKRRDWLAHRLYIEQGSNRSYQIQSLKKLIEKADRVNRLMVGVLNHIAQKVSRFPDLPKDHIVNRLAAPFEAESKIICESITSQMNDGNTDEQDHETNG